MVGPKLTGIFCPHMVPLDEWGGIHEAELRRLVEWLIARGVHGLYPNGSSGEFTLFSPAERRRITEIVVDQTRGRALVMAGATEPTVDECLAACEHYKAIGCDCAAILPPYYFKMTQPNVREYFRLLAKHSPLDLVLYNIPQYANEISIEVVRDLAELPRIIGIKDSSRDFARYVNTMAAVRPVRPDFSFLIGCEEILVPSLIMGGDGGTLATSGVVPELLVRMYEDTRAGRLDQAVRDQYSLLDLIREIVFGLAFPEGLRTALTVRGFAMGRPRQPLAPECEPDVNRVRLAMARHLAALGCPLEGERGGEGEQQLPGWCSGVTAERGGSGMTADAPSDSSMEAIVRRVVGELTARGRGGVTR
jgi:4-hydroxy-tetrahydrodipicolinate synthase